MEELNQLEMFMEQLGPNELPSAEMKGEKESGNGKRLFLFIFFCRRPAVGHFQLKGLAGRPQTLFHMVIPTFCPFFPYFVKQTAGAEALSLQIETIIRIQ